MAEQFSKASRLKLKPGDLMDLQYGPYRAQFRIVWMGKLGSDQQGEVGLQRLPLEECIWGVNLEASCAMAGKRVGLFASSYIG